MEHHEEYQATAKRSGKQHNILPLWGNEATMNLNPLILANIQGSSYFKVHLFKLKTYHEVVDEIYYQVKHLEPWERGSRKTAGQTGMCGGVRGVGAGGIVSTAFCLLYKLYTLRLTRKQVNGLLGHTDSPYIRALGFMYIRYTQPPGDLYDWYEDYLLDEEEIDVKAGGGQIMTIGQMSYQFLTKLDWFSTLFPRIPVPMQKQIEKRLIEFSRENNINFNHLHQTYSARHNNSYAAAGSGSGNGGAGGAGNAGGGVAAVGGGGGGANAVAAAGGAGVNAYYGSTSGRYNAGGGAGAGASAGAAGGGFNYNDRERGNDRGGDTTERRRRDDRDFYERERERERVSREYYGGYRDNNRRDDRYNRSKSRSRSRTREEKQKTKKKSKNKDRDRSRDKREKLHYRERSPERYRERERERDKRYH